MQENNTKIYYKLYQLTKHCYGVVKNFEKEYKYTIGRDIIELLWKCLDLSVEANICPNESKKPKIAELSVTFEKLKTRIQMSQEIKILSVRQFTHLQEEFMLEIGKMIGGWGKWGHRKSK
jgi:hypothetical protein